MKFLAQDWFDAVNAYIKTDEELQASIGSISVAIQQHVTDCPGGEDIFHFMKVSDGEAVVGLGKLDEPDATMKADYESSAAMQRGELDIMSAFSGGKMMVTGNMAVLMTHQGTLTQLNRAFESTREDTEYES